MTIAEREWIEDAMKGLKVLRCMLGVSGLAGADIADDMVKNGKRLLRRKPKRRKGGYEF